MKRAMLVLAGFTLATAAAAAHAGETPRPAKPEAGKKAEGKGRAVVAKKDEPAKASDAAVSADDELTATLDGVEPDTRPSIRVLDNPYDIASFYRADSGRGGFFMGDEGSEGGRYPIAGFYRAEGGHGPYAIAGFYRSGGGSGRYPIASFYRGGQGAYGGFWNSGYGPHRGARGLVGYRRSIGANGDIFLVVPFLAPVGPLSESFNR